MTELNNALNFVISYFFIDHKTDWFVSSKHLTLLDIFISALQFSLYLQGGYCLQSLAEGAALTLRALLGDPCPLLPSQGRPCEG